MYSVFDIFKISIGPSSSHTLGPMKAGKRFIEYLQTTTDITNIDEITVDIHGSLALTGKGHHTDTACILGLAGFDAEYVDIDKIPSFINKVKETQILPILNGKHQVHFPHEALNFINTPLPLHENGLIFHATTKNNTQISQTYYSIGGGFIVDAEHFGEEAEDNVKVPYPFHSATSLLAFCTQENISISTLMLRNELCMNSQQYIDTRLQKIWRTMQEGIQRGCRHEGVLAGALHVPRRAPPLQRMLASSSLLNNDPMIILDWVALFALAVSEENASGGRVVTAPTNGAAGIIPAVLSYYDKFIEKVNQEQYSRFFFTAAAIASLYKENASISGAEVGCQGEIGVSCSMAAAGLTELLGGSPMHVAEAAEIAMEHHLGLTCDPVAGQVQVPCIERNAISAMTAINASRMALRRTTNACVSLDKVIKTMYATGKDMNAKYRETSQGGLAIQLAYTCT